MNDLSSAQLSEISRDQIAGLFLFIVMVILPLAVVAMLERPFGRKIRGVCRIIVYSILSGVVCFLAVFFIDTLIFLSQHDSEYLYAPNGFAVGFFGSLIIQRIAYFRRRRRPLSES